MAVERPAQSPSAQSPSADQPSEVGVQPRLFTVDEYYKMAEAGILKPDERVELIEGEIVQMPPAGPEHADTVDTVAEVFGDRLRPRVRIRVQSPIGIAGVSQPEPDVTLLKTPAERGTSYRSSHPGLDDVLLVVEVADSSLTYDLQTKAGMYALRGILELWVIDISHDRLMVHRQPTPEGYASVETVERGTTVSPLAFPDVVFTADELLG